MNKVRSTCKVCNSENIYYYAHMIVKGVGTMQKDGSIDEFSEHDEMPLKYKITGYFCMDCPYDDEKDDLL